MADRLTFPDWLFDTLLPEMRETFGNRKNWQRFCLIADQMAAELALRRWL